MPTEMRYCRECQAMTPHVVVSGKEITAHLCEECLWRWSTEIDVTEKQVRGRLAPHPRRRIQNASSERQSDTQDKDRRL